MSVHVLGLALHKPADRIDDLRLEEMVYRTARAALEDAGVTRGQLDSVTLGACDELDGRSISSMLMAMPAGAYLTDEIKVTDSAATALCLATARILSGDFHLCMVASWCKSSKTDVEAVMRLRGEPFFTRPFGLNMTLADALFAQAVAGRFGIAPEEAASRVVAGYERASRNPRGVGRAIPTVAAIAGSEWEATPLRRGHRAPMTDGAVCMVLASGKWLRANKGTYATGPRGRGGLGDRFLPAGRRAARGHELRPRRLGVGVPAGGRRTARPGGDRGADWLARGGLCADVRAGRGRGGLAVRRSVRAESAVLHRSGRRG